MKITPIILSAPMVLATLDGRKSMTRRVIKPQPVDDPSSSMPWVDDGPTPSGAGRVGHSLRLDECPYGKPGDLLWVREKHQRLPLKHGFGAIRYMADAATADIDERGVVPESFDMTGQGLALRPALPAAPGIYMQRSHARLWLRVEAVRVERLQDITRGDAMAEGCPFANMAKGPDPRDWYRDLWDSLNAKRGHAWELNPWVWVVTYSVSSRTGERGLAK